MSATKYEEIRKQMDKLRNEAKKTGQKYFKNMCKSLFKDYPALESFAFHQYTVNFNDGDTCYFSVYNDDPTINGVKGYVSNYNEERSFEFEQEDDEIEGREFLGFDSKEQLGNCACEIQEILQTISDDDMKEIFGDHTTVIVNRNAEIEQEDYYDHD